MAEVEVPTSIAGMMGGMEGFIVALPFILATIVMALIIFVALWKTPLWVFLRAFLGGKNLIAMKRKDGALEFVPAAYNAGLLKSKYGVQILDEGSAMPEKKSGVRVAFGVDTIGITLHPKMMQTISALRNDYGFKDVKEITEALDYWRTCKKCGHDGLTTPIFKEETSKLGDIEETRQVFSHLVCKKCESKELKRSFPKVTVPLYQTISLEEYDKYFKYNYTPSRNDIIIEREVKAQMLKQRQFPVKWIAIAMAFTIIIIGLMIGLNIYQSNTLSSDPSAMLSYCKTLLQAQAPITG